MAKTAPLPDAAPTNWVDRFAPAAVRPLLKLGRFDRPTGIWLLMLPGWQGVALAAAERGERPDWRLLVAFFIGAALMRAAGCAYNDIVDRDIDAKVARTAGRPIPSGQISVKQAWSFLIVCCLFSLLVVGAMGKLALLLAVASLALVAAYPFMKRITWWPQVWLGLTFNWGALLGYAAATAVTGSLFYHWNHPTWNGSPVIWDFGSEGDLALSAFLLYAHGVFWTLGYDTIYAVQDLEDDALAGVKSSARRLGKAVRPAVLGFYAVAVVLVLAAGWVAELGWGFYALAALYAVRLFGQGLKVRTDNPRLALRLFKANTWAGLVLFAAIVAGSYVFRG